MVLNPVGSIQTHTRFFYFEIIPDSLEVGGRKDTQRNSMLLKPSLPSWDVAHSGIWLEYLENKYRKELF